MEGRGCLRLCLSFHLLHHVGIEELGYITGIKQKARKEHKWGRRNYLCVLAI